MVLFFVQKNEVGVKQIWGDGVVLAFPVKLGVKIKIGGLKACNGGREWKLTVSTE